MRQTGRLGCRPSVQTLEDRQLMTMSAISALAKYHVFYAGTASGLATVATFKDSAPAPLGYNVTINWGDGTNSAGTVASDPVVSGQFNVSGSHTYNDPGVEFVSVSITNVQASTQRTVSSFDPVVVPTPVVTSLPVSGLAVDDSVDNVLVATFTDTDMNLAAANFSANVDWGDGEVAGASVSADPIVPGKFLVNATKPDAYAHAGTADLKVSVSVPGLSPPRTWVNVAGMPQALGFVSATLANGQIYRFGGTNGFASQTVDSYDPVTNSWTSRTTLPVGQSVIAVATAADGSVNVLSFDSDYLAPRMLRYDPVGNTWSQSGTIAVNTTGVAMTAGPDGKIYILGGTVSSEVSAVVQTYDPATGAVATVASLPSARSDLAAVTGPDGRIYAIGGYDGTNPTAEVDAFDPATGMWSLASPLIRPRSTFTASVGQDGKIYAIAGNGAPAGFSGYDVEAYDSSTGTWSMVEQLNGFRLFMNSTVGPDGRVYVLGGAGPTAQVSAYNPIDTTGSSTIPVTVAKGTPSVHWDDPANIVEGTPLSGAQLNATSKAEGTFSYTPGVGTVLASGLAQTLSTTFHPANTDDYNSVVTTSQLNVLTKPIVVVTAPTVIAGVAPTAAPVATFTDPLYVGATASDFNAVVDWGDGTTSPGVITADPNVAGRFIVTATKSAAYTVVANKSLKVTVQAVGQTIPGAWTTAATFDLQQAELAAATSGGKIYAIGGYLDDDDYTDRVVVYDPATQTTTEVAPLPIPLEDHAAVTGPDGTIYVFGGDNDDGSYLDVAFAYNPITDTWTSIAPLPTGRQYLGGALGADGKIYAIGGDDGDDYTSEVDAYDPATDTWTTVSPMPAGLEGMGVATGLDGKIYVMGGYDGDEYVSTVYVYDTATDVWTQLSDMPVALGYFGAATASDGTIYAIGGDTNGDSYLATVYTYDPATDTWTQAPDLPDGAEENAAATGPDGRVYAIGGFTYSEGPGGFYVLDSTVTPTGSNQATLVVSPNVATSFDVSYSSEVKAGQAQTVTITARDAYGNVATGYSGQVVLTSTDPHPIFASPATVTNGVGTFSVALTTLGIQSISATDSVNPGLTVSTAEILVTHGLASNFVVTGGVNAPAGTVQTITVRAYDAYGNVVTDFDGLVSLSSSDPIATLPPAFSLIEGVATINVTLKTAGTMSISATSTGSPAISGTDAGIIISPLAASGLQLVGTSNALHLVLTVTARDVYGNLVTGYTGTVHFSGDPQSVMPADSTLTNGVGMFTIDFPAPGAKTVAATDTINPGLTSSGTFVLSKAQTQAGAIVASAPQTFYGENVVLTATFSATQAGSAPMTGTVTFFDGDTALGTVAISSLEASQLRAAALTFSGHASLSTTLLTPGGHVIRAVYSGDANYSSATSITPVAVVVMPATTSTNLTSVTSAQGTILTAAVAVTSPGQPAVVGTVSFYDGDTLLGTVSVTGGVATLSLPPLSAGVHSFRAVFAGGGLASASDSSAQVSTDGPMVVGLSRYGFHASPTLLTLTFDGPLDAARAENPANYRILDGRGRPIAVAAVHYDPSTLSVTISPARRLDIHRAYTLTVLADGPNGVAGSTGLAMDGAGTGQPGTNFTTRITWTALAIPGRSPAVTFVKGQAHAFTGKFGPYVNAIVRASGAALNSAFRVKTLSHAVAPKRAAHPRVAGSRTSKPAHKA